MEWSLISFLHKNNVYLCYDPDIHSFMAIPRNMKKTILFILLLSAGLCVKAQNLTQYNSFFISKLPEVKEFLDYSNLGVLLVLDTILVSDESLLVKIRCVNKEIDGLAGKNNLDRLNVMLVKEFNQSYGEILFDKITFMLDLKETELKIQIDCDNALVVVKFSNEKVVTIPMIKMGNNKDNYLVKLALIRGIGGFEKVVSDQTLERIKDKLIKGLKEHFRYAEAMFEKYEFNVYDRLENRLELDIINVIKLVIPDDRYFEHINIKFTLNQVDNSLLISYTIQAKYGAGILWAPKSEDYYDMTPKYQAELDLFSLKLKNKIDSLLKK
jgi:hypothetical protein